MTLSERMKAVIGLAEPCECIADIGCDHGYVAIELVRRGLCRRVIAMDINKGPLERARANIASFGLEECIQTRQSDGAGALLEGEADGIICAGMGGRLIISILENDMAVIKQMRQIILQPQSELSEVRKYLRQNGFAAVREDIVCEDGKYYPMMCVKTGMADSQENEPLHIFDTYGRGLLESANPVMRQYLLYQRDKLGHIKKGLQNGKDMTQRQQQRAIELDSELADINFCLDNYFR